MAVSRGVKRPGINAARLFSVLYGGDCMRKNSAFQEPLPKQRYVLNIVWLHGKMLRAEGTEKIACIGETVLSCPIYKLM